MRVINMKTIIVVLAATVRKITKEKLILPFKERIAEEVVEEDIRSYHKEKWGRRKHRQTKLCNLIILVILAMSPSSTRSNQRINRLKSRNK